jgi:hypothetical protein
VELGQELVAGSVSKFRVELGQELAAELGQELVAGPVSEFTVVVLPRREFLPVMERLLA